MRGQRLRIDAGIGKRTTAAVAGAALVRIAFGRSRWMLETMPKGGGPGANAAPPTRVCGPIVSAE